MEGADEIRSSTQQISDEFHEMYRQMTDPEEIEKQKLKQTRKEYVDEQKEDSGI